MSSLAEWRLFAIITPEAASPQSAPKVKLSMWTANIPSREAYDLQGTAKFAFLRDHPGVLVAVFAHRGKDIEIRLKQLGQIDADDNVTYPLLSDQRWIAYGTRDGEPIAIYEFFSGKADPFDLQVAGAKLVGSALTVDAAHLGVGIGRGMIKSLYDAGIFIVPSEKMTAAGAGLFNSLQASGVDVPTAGWITQPWPR